MKVFIKDNGTYKEGKIVGAIKGNYLVEMNGKQYTVAPQNVLERKERKVGDEVVAHHKDGDRYAISKGIISDITKTKNNDGEEVNLYKIKVGSREHEVNEQDLDESVKSNFSPQKEADKPEHSLGFHNEARKKIEDVMYDVYTSVQDKYKFGKVMVFDTFKKAIGPDIDHYVDGHFKIRTGTTDGGEGHAVFKPTSEDTHELKQVQYNAPEATPFTHDDIKRGEFSTKEIGDKVKKHLEHHYDKIKKEHVDNGEEGI